MAITSAQFTVGSADGTSGNTVLGMHRSVAWVDQGDITPLNYGGSDMLGLNVNTTADTIELYFVDTLDPFGASVTVDFGAGGTYVLLWDIPALRYKIIDAVQSDALWAFFSANYTTTVPVIIT